MKILCHHFEFMGANSYLIVDENTNCSALVDCAVFDADVKNMIGDTDLKYILLTHGHFDHIGGVKAIADEYGAGVVISEKDAPMLNSSKLSLAVFCSAPHNNVNADILVKDGNVIELGKLNIRVIETPGHTVGSVCYAVENALFTGDTLFKLSCGRCDFPGGSSADMTASLKKLSSLEGNYNVYPGHDGLTDLDFERKNNPYMSL